MSSHKPQSFSIIIIFVLFMMVGGSLIPLLNLQFVPSRTQAGITVSYTWPNASAKVIEQEVTSKLEGLFSTVKGVQNINSVSKKGQGNIHLNFKKHINLDAVRFELSTLIRQSYRELPEGVSYPTLSLGINGKNSTPILTYTLNANASPFHIQKYAKEQLVPYLSQLEGINEVNVYGATPFEWEIRFDAERIRQLSITGDEIAQGIHNYFRKDILGLGKVQIAGLVYPQQVRVQLQMDISEEVNWSKIPLKKNKERIIYLTDIAQIRYLEQTPRSYFRINGLNTVNMVIYPEEEVNTLHLAETIKKEIHQIKQQLPTGYTLLTSYDSTEFLSKELHKILLRTLFSMGILLTFVLLTSRQWRYLIIITLSLAANLLIAFIFYYFFHLEIHLYSLAGITVSFGLMIDNSIVMIDHLRHHKNRKVFLAILAATLTTIGSVLIVFLLKAQQQINLIDFAQVLIVNLGVSLLIAYFFIPALFDKIRLKERRNKSYFKRKQRVVRFTGQYGRFLLWGRRFRWAFILLLVLGFGLPVHWFPEKLEHENSFWAALYNQTLGSDWYNENARSWVNKSLGGSFRLFTEEVFNQSFYSDPQRTTLYVSGKMPEGCTVQQLNQAIEKMENFISKFDEVEMFQTRINSYRNSSINIHFKEAFENGSFPYFLKSQLETKAISLGGVDWGVYGVGRGFSNALSSGYKNSGIILNGYNYEQLYAYAELLRSDLLNNPRIKEVDITGSFGWNANPLHEYYLDFHLEQFGLHDVSLQQFYAYLKDQTYRMPLSPIFQENEWHPVSLVSERADKFNVWNLNNEFLDFQEKSFKLASLGSVEKRKTGNEIHKNNQQYQLALAYDFIGSNQLSKIVMDRQLERIKEILPLGYQANARGWGGWQKDSKSQYYLLFIVILVIYFICAIVLESLLQPLAVISLIPISFIGVFLTFYLFDFNFDQGGYASFILLSGIVVNTALYIINDFNSYCKKFGQHKLAYYLKAYNSKIIPVLLTILSSVLGLVPFVWSGQHESFWFAFASGSMGGLLFSVLAVWIYLPLFLKIKDQ
ncbi:efflux RND transporter permease subunit [Rapidithrix thailandica]|uniref:Efflux RND transporter permease subunit n=1 Tax=Rapidithrix thailandica TaxID=413964 RepID=A0AAW9S8J2_9BACT